MSQISQLYLITQILKAMIKFRETKTLNEFQGSCRHYDMLICCASFEDRCLAVASSVNLSMVDKALVCRYSGYSELSESNFNKLHKVLSDKVKDIAIDKDAPLLIYDTLFDEISRYHPKSVIIDISTFTRETILIILMLFKQDIFKDISVTIGYVPADRYSDSPKDGTNDIWLSKGVNGVRSVLGYAGSFTSLKKTLLVVLVGFEKERAEFLINSFEADKLYLGCVPPQESQNEELSTINKMNFDRLVSVVGGCCVFEFSCRYLQQTYDVLKKIIDENKDDYNIIISPMNNKLSTLAVANVAFEYPDVQVCYASTNQYNTGAYSSPSQKVILFDFE